MFSWKIRSCGYVLTISLYTAAAVLNDVKSAATAVQARPYHHIYRHHLYNFYGEVLTRCAVHAVNRDTDELRHGLRQRATISSLAAPIGTVGLSDIAHE